MIMLDYSPIQILKFGIRAALGWRCGAVAIREGCKKQGLLEEHVSSRISAN